MAKVWKTINPPNLRVKTMRNHLITAMRSMGKSIEADFQKTVATWDHKPDFGPSPPIVQDSNSKLTVEVSTDDQVYSWLDEGTKKNYPIVPVRAKALYYASNFSPKTKPKRLRSDPGYIGPKDTFSQGVTHPGITKREFDETIAKRQEKRFGPQIEKAMTKAARGSGHYFP